MKKKTHAFLGKIKGFLILVIVQAVRTSPSYQECRGAADIWRCTGHFIDKNDSIILALATALFTIVLVVVTNRQARLTKEALIADKRSFVFADGIKPEWHLDRGSGQYHWRFRPAWRNSGDTPTKGLTIYTDCELRNSLLPSGYNFNQTRLAPGTGMLGPKTQMFGGLAPHIPGVGITPQDILGIQQERKFLCLWGWARYFDTFPETPEHITRFCWQIVAVGDPLHSRPARSPHCLTV